MLSALKYSSLKMEANLSYSIRLVVRNHTDPQIVIAKAKFNNDEVS